MRILIASLTIAFLSACGTNQSEQISKPESLAKQDESQIMMDKSSSEMSSDMATSETNMVNANNNVEDLKVEETDSNVVSETTSDNGMIKETGIQAENSQANEAQPMDAMEGQKDEVAKEKDSTDKKVVEEKS